MKGKIYKKSKDIIERCPSNILIKDETVENFASKKFEYFQSLKRITFKLNQPDLSNIEHNFKKIFEKRFPKLKYVRMDLNDVPDNFIVLYLKSYAARKAKQFEYKSLSDNLSFKTVEKLLKAQRSIRDLDLEVERHERIFDILFEKDKSMLIRSLKIRLNQSFGNQSKKSFYMPRMNYSYLQELSLQYSNFKLRTNFFKSFFTKMKFPFLKDLILKNIPLSGSAFKSFSSNQSIKNLKNLRLHNCEIGDSDILYFAKSNKSKNILEFSLTNNLISGACIEFLLAYNSLPKLKRITLNTIYFTKKIFKFFRSRALSSIELSFDEFDDTSKEVMILGNSIKRERLNRLIMNRSFLKENQLIKIFQKQKFFMLRNLNLSENKLSKISLNKILNSYGLSLLVDLNLSNSGIDDGTASVIMQSRNCSRIRNLNLSTNKLSSKFFRSILGSKGLDHLEFLDLHQNNFEEYTNYFFYYFSSKKVLNLKRLNICDSKLNNNHFQGLVASRCLKELYNLHLGYNPDINDDIQHFAQLLINFQPNIKINLELTSVSPVIFDPFFEVAAKMKLII